MKNKWRTDIRKGGTDYNITNEKYTFHVGEAFRGIKFSQEKGKELFTDANNMCNLLNKKIIQELHSEVGSTLENCKEAISDYELSNEGGDYINQGWIEALEYVCGMMINIERKDR